MEDRSTYGFSGADADELLNMIGSGDREFREFNPAARSNPVIHRFFELIEDVDSTDPDLPVWVKRVRRGESTELAIVQMYGYEEILANARAGYRGLMAKVDGDWVFAQGPCIIACESDAEIDPGDPPEGEVGEAYTHTVTGTGLDGDITITGLPDGLSGTDGEITGTPTEAGTFYAVATGEEGDCVITKVVVIVIAEAEEE